jgi:hypothetical protein
MVGKIRPATQADVNNVAIALAMLQDARDLLTAAGAPQTLARVRLAISSAKGALRHARHRRDRTTTAKPRAVATSPYLNLPLRTLAEAARDYAAARAKASRHNRPLSHDSVAVPPTM